MIHIIASDLDGTLLGKDHKIAPQTKAAVKQACDAGIRFIVTTGRSFRGALQAVEGCDFACDFLTANGAEIRDAKYQVVHSMPLSYDICADIFALKEQYAVDMICFSQDFDFRFGDVLFTKNFILPHPQQSLLTRIPAAVKQCLRALRCNRNIQTIHDWTVLKEHQIPIYKIDLIVGDAETARRLREKLSADCRFALAFSSVTDLEITNPAVQKGPMLKQYIESLGHSMDEVMVLGDSMNDYSMLSMDFGMTVAMEQALPEVKSAAKYITKSNEDYGVAVMIDRLLKNGKNIL